MNEENKNMNEAVEQQPVQETSQTETVTKSPSNGEEVPNTLQNDTPEQSSLGPLVGVAIIIIVLIAGGIYFWSTTVDKDEGENQLPTIQSGGEADAVVNRLNTQGTSDEIIDIEADLNRTDLENLDSELNELLNKL